MPFASRGEQAFGLWNNVRLPISIANVHTRGNEAYRKYQ